MVRTLKMVTFVVGFSLWLSPLMAQEANYYPRDTSYTLHSAYQKYVKRHPFIEVIKAETPEGIAKKEEVVYRQLENRKLKLDVYYPAQKKEKYPAVLLVHGGGWRTGSPSLLEPLAQQLAAAGYVTALPEYRLSLEAPYPAALHDLKAAVRWLRTQNDALPIDTARIAVLGTSAGGQLAALLGTTNNISSFEGEGPNSQYSSAIQAIVDIDGVLAFHHPESEEGSMAAQWLGGTYEEVPEIWEEASALRNAGSETPPVLFIGSAFPRFLAGRDDMLKILKQHDIYTESYTLPEAPHSFWLFHPWFEPTFNYTVDFLDRVLKEAPKK